MEILADVVFSSSGDSGKSAGVITTRRVVELSGGPSGSRLQEVKRLEAIPNYIIRFRSNNEEDYHLGFGSEPHQTLSGQSFSDLGSVLRVGLSPARIHLQVRGKEYLQNVPEIEGSRFHFVLSRYPNTPGGLISCLRFSYFEKKPSSKAQLWVFEDVVVEDYPDHAGALKPVLQTEVSTRTECPPIDLAGGVIALVDRSDLWVGHVSQGVLLCADRKIFWESEIAETCTLSSDGKQLALVARNTKDGSLRCIWLDLQRWLDEVTKRKTKITPPSIEDVFADREVKHPDYQGWNIFPLRVAPTLDWMVVEASKLENNLLKSSLEVIWLNQ